MSTLISSAVGGSKAKPKAPPRRRPLPSAAPAKAPPVANVPTDDQTAAGSASTDATPAADTQVNDAGPYLPPPSPPVVVERTFPQPVVPIANAAPVAPMRGTSSSINNNEDISQRSIHGEVYRVQEQHADEGAEPQTSTSFLPTPSSDQEHDTNSGEHNNGKRARDTDRDAAPVQNKRVRRTAERSSLTAQAIAEGELSTAHQDVLLATPPSTNDAAEAQSAAVSTPAQDDAQIQPPRRASQRKSTQEKSSRTAQKRASRARKNATAVGAEEPNATINTATGQPAKRVRKRSNKRASAAPTEEEANQQIETADAEEEAGEESEDPENHQIDPASLSMYDLSLEGRYGKTSEREKKMAKIDWAAVKRKRIEEAEAIMRGDFRKDKEASNAVQSTESADGQAHQEGEEEGETTRPEPVTRASQGGVQFRVVNGQIVEDETSLTIDRAARLVEATAAEADAPIEEENDLTVRFNRTTYINARRREETERVPLWRSKSDAWSEEETDRFYDALRMFGTDFFIISKMFPPKTRKHIKLKFVREERLEPKRINDALLGINGVKQEKIDLDHYAQAIDRDVADFHKYDGLAHANEVIRASMADREEEMRAAVKEDEENNRQREAQRLQREKQRLEAEKKKEERNRRRIAKRRGEVWGTGTFGAADDDGADAE